MNLKALKAGGVATHGTGRWTKGRWRTVHGPLVPCENGIHYCVDAQILGWISDELWLFEDGSPDETIDRGDKMVTRRGRVTRKLAWDERSAVLFAADCAEHVLPVFEQRYPGDDRPRRAVEAARAYANGAIDKNTMDAAKDAADAAAWAAVEDAARAARDAARAAARAAARDAAWWDAAGAAGAAARAAEREWQWQRLLTYIEETP